MIVRIAGEDQFRLGDSEEARVKELDEAVLDAIERGDEAGFQSSFATLLDFVRRGSPLSDDDLEASDLILPPSDTTLTEARDDFNGEGWLPE